MIQRVSCLAALLLCLCGCVTTPPTPPPKESEWVPLKLALQVVARDLNEAAPVILSDIGTPDGKSQLANALFMYQCADNSADPPLLVITGSVSLQLQGSIQNQGQAGITVGFPTLANLAYQVQVSKGQQQQLTVPITFVAASALPNFFLGQNLPNMSTLPDLPDSLPTHGVDDKQLLGHDKAKFQLALVDKANLINTVVQQEIAKYPADRSGCRKDEKLSFVLPALSIVLPQALQ